MAMATATSSPPQVPSFLKARADLLVSALGPSPDVHAAVAHVLTGRDSEEHGLPPDLMRRVQLASTIADFSNDNSALLSTVVKEPQVQSLRDVAFTYNPATVASVLSTPSSTPLSSSKISRNRAITPDPFWGRLFQAEPSAVLHRMVVDHQINLSEEVQSGVNTFFNNQPKFNIRQTSVLKAVNEPGALNGISPSASTEVVNSLKTLQRIQALTPSPEAVPVLHNAGVQNALQVATTPKQGFVTAFADSIPEKTALQIHDHAVATTFRNEQALLQIYQTIKGTGLAILDGTPNIDIRIAQFQKLASQKSVNINLEELFGGMDFCECDDCTTVTSPAAYYVDLLQYVRNNDLDNSVDANGKPKFPNTGESDFKDSIIEKLFLRRPDLQHLQLTCENTNTLIPYIDLANEIMESFVVHLDSYTKNWSKLQQTEIDVFNVHDETSSDLLSEPQHTNYKAYCILLQKVYPLGKLPYHQPIEAIRIYLKFLGTSRYEVLDRFQRPLPKPGSFPQVSSINELAFEVVEREVLDRSSMAEFLNIIQEEYIILTKEAFWPREYFMISGDPSVTVSEYQRHIGLKTPHEYWGYESGTDLLSDDEILASGLRFVKAQFIPRSGMTYPDIVTLVKTNYVNPAYPKGQDLMILEGIRFSYRFLQTLVDNAAKTQEDRFAQLVDFLAIAQPWVELYGKQAAVDQDNKECEPSMSRKDIWKWVHTWFDCLAKLVVLESGEGPTLPIEGNVYYKLNDEARHLVDISGTNTVPGLPVTAPFMPRISRLDSAAEPSSVKPDAPIGTLNADGRILDPAGKLIATVAVTSQVFNTKGTLLANDYPHGTLYIENPLTSRTQQRIVVINRDGYLQWTVDSKDIHLVSWNAVVDTCNLDKVRLIHLDGSDLSIDEWDRMHRFIRLWLRLGWTIDEVDSALMGLATTQKTNSIPDGGTKPKPGALVSLNDFISVNCADSDNCDGCDGCSCSGDCDCGCNGNVKSACSDIVLTNISPQFLKELFYVQKLLDVTGLDVVQLLSFWAEIGTDGDDSLYSQLFLIHNILGVDPVFKADTFGNYFNTVTPVSDHLPLICAAVHLTSANLAAILDYTKLGSASLTLETISTIYRYALLSQSLGLKVPLLLEAIRLLGDPFKDAAATLSFFTTYGDMTDQGFTTQTLGYSVLGVDDPIYPVGPQKVGILKTTKTLFDGLNAIVSTYPDLQPAPAPPEPDPITLDMFKTYVSLLFDSTVSGQISGLVEGTSTYTTNAPIALTITVPDSLKAKVVYLDPVNATGTNRNATITVTGILSKQEVNEAKALAPGSAWASAIDRVGKQALTLYKNVLSPIFPNMEKATCVLLAGDVAATPPPMQPVPDGTPRPDPGTAPGKRRFFLRSFIPYLRDQLENQLVASTMSGEAGIASSAITMTLLTTILTVSTGQKALDLLKSLQKAPANSSHWTGYLIPPTSDSYTFVGIGDTIPASLMVDGESVPFKYQQDDPNNVWSTSPVPLIGGSLYMLDAGGQSVPGLQWKTARSTISAIPSSSLLPDFSTKSAMEVFVKLTKAAIIINGFSLSVDEITYFQAHGADFSGFDLNNMKLPAWKRILAYAELRISLPKLSFSLVDLFKWASILNGPQKAGDLASTICQATQWDLPSVTTLLGSDCLDITDPTLFLNEIILVKLSKLLKVTMSIAVPIPYLFKWADPMAKFWPSHAIAEDIRKAIRSQHSLSDWEQLCQPLHNQLRMSQRDALISYLTVQDDLRKWGVVDADSLFEFFLIDVQMGACLQTSRIKQAISSVQTFIQRSMLGLEKDYGVRNDAIDQSRWPALSKETIRTANVKVFLTPENYIVPSLRDDKSPIYGAMENDILQKDINPQALRNSLTKYIYNMDDVSNLLVEGIFQDNDADQTLYIIGKTRSTPYQFFSRTFSGLSRIWTPWNSISVNISTLQVDATASTPAYDGSYIVPIVWQGRFLLFFGEFMKKTIPRDFGTDKIQSINKSPSDLRPLATWEIKIGWSELQNGKWSQKQVTVGAVMETVTDSDPPAIDSYRFVSEFLGKAHQTWISIGVYRNGVPTAVGRFEFKGQKAALAVVDDQTSKLPWAMNTKFHFVPGKAATTTDVAVPNIMYPFQRNADGTFQPDSTNSGAPFASYPTTDVSTSKITVNGHSYPFYHQFSHQLISAINLSTDLGAMFKVLQKPPDKKSAFGFAGHVQGDDGVTYPQFNELSTPYALYNWELGFHAPMELANALLQNQQFEAALAMCHYVFNPYANGSGQERVWTWAPFALVNSENVLESLFNALAPDKPDNSNQTQITEWRKNPFMPHTVARNRPVAYMKWTVITYLQILIAYGDYHFRQNTLEAVPLAIQCYILASHIYGPRSQTIPKRGIVKPQSYYSLRNKWDAFSNAVVDMELSFPFSNQSTHPFEISGQQIVLGNLFGFSTTHYFNIPDNPQLRALRDLIDDRLYKIRHCQDINGNAISLALWEPPLDPALLVNAVAQGLSLSNILNDLNAPLPNYRFYYLLQKAFELCSELRALGGAFLMIKEKRDSQALELLRATHENTIQTLVMQIRTMQVEESGRTIDALRISRNGPMFRYKFYSALSGYTVTDLVETDSTFNALDLPITPPTTDGDLVLTATESNEISEALSAKTLSDDVGALEVFDAMLQLLPSVSVSLEPWGIGGSLGFGPQNIAANFASQARLLRILSDGHTFGSTNSSRKSQFIRQLQDRVQLANSAGYEVKNIDSQIAAQLTRINIANQEITNQQKQIDNSQEIIEFLKDKYTNDDLYSWTENSVRGLFRQTYNLAYDIAKKAEAAYFFERGRQSGPAQFIQFGYWDQSHDGLQSGEQLYLALKQMESAYQLNRGYDFEVMKSISLRQLNPTALIQLRETGLCQFDIPEVLFDMDFPGHYFRRIKSVSLTIPCVVGPYTSVSCTLQLLKHRYRNVPTAKDAKSYVEQTDNGMDSRFQTGAIPIDSVAISTAQNDTGAFEISFKDERYIPFEGSGVISSWQLELPSAFRQFDYSSITDVIMSIRYTSLNGGDTLKKPARDSVTAFVASVQDLSMTEGLFSLFDIKSEFASEWVRAAVVSAASPPAAGSQPLVRSITFTNLTDRLPFFAKTTGSRKVTATDVTLLTATDLPSSAYRISTDPTGSVDPIQFDDAGDTIGSLHVFHKEDANASIGDWVLTITGGYATLVLKKIFLLIRFTLS